MLCILYVNVIGLCLALAGLSLERALPATASRRWIWCVAIVLSLVVPATYQAHHRWSITSARPALATAAIQGHEHGAPAVAVLDPGWWQRAHAYDPFINRVWVTMSGILIAWGALNVLWVSGLVYRSRRGRGSAGGSAVVDGVRVVVTRSVGPATVGLLRSSVLVPRWVLALPSVQRRYVVRHEEEHRRAHDAHLLFVTSLTLILIPWSLALWWMLRRLHLAVEMDCDNRVVNALGDAPAYGDLLLRVAEASSRGPRLQPALLGGMGMLERRLTRLLAPTPLRHVERWLLPALACVLLAFVLSMPHPVAPRAAVAPSPSTLASSR
jgi:hypothetical protein